MLRVSLLLILLTHRTRTAYVTDPPSFADRLDRIYEKLERFTVAPADRKLREKLDAKLEHLNSLTPDRTLSDDDEELLSAIQMWGASEEQIRRYIQDLQPFKDEDKSERLTDGEYDGDWNDDDETDPEGDYANDVGDEWGDPIDDDISSTSKPHIVTPSAITKLDRTQLSAALESAVEAMAFTNERPRILDDTPSTPEGRTALHSAVMANMGNVVRAGKCLSPQPRWLSVRKLAPAADTVYLPPCVQLHRCAADSGCCHNESDVCAPVEGRYVAIPFYLNKANGDLNAARIVFYNHTRCACVSREALARPRALPEARRATRQHEWRAPTDAPPLPADEERTAPPQMRMCTCPRLFRNRISDGVCSCVCDWAEASRRRDCLSLSRGREHFGLRDRVCIDQGSCALPGCDHGAYDRKAGRCPARRYKRRNSRRLHLDKPAIV